MSRMDRVRLVLSLNCAASISIKEFSPTDLQEIVNLAVQRKVPLTIRDATEKDPTTLTTLATLGKGHVVFEF